MSEMKPKRYWNDLSWIKDKEFGIVVLANGEVGCTSITRCDVGFALRIESGEYRGYNADGTQEGGKIRLDRRIVAFIPLTFDSPLIELFFNGFDI